MVQDQNKNVETPNGSIAINRGLLNLNLPCSSIGTGCTLSITQQF